MPNRTIVQSDYYNAIYEDGVLSQEGKPERLSAETLARLFPEAAIFWVPDDVYEQALNGAGYPDRLTNFPLTSCTKIR